MFRILHLLGATEDTGGILTVLRNLQTATAAWGWEHVVWVNAAYREVRSPALQYRFSRHLLQDSFNHRALVRGAVLAWSELRALRRIESFDVIHAHTRGGLVLAVLVAALGRENLVFTNHGFARRRGLYRWAARRRRLHTCVLTPNMARYYGLAPDTPNLHVVSECCADALFARPLVAHRVIAPDERLRLVGLGNIVEWKKWHLVLEALARLPAAERDRLRFEHWGPTPSGPECAAYEARLRQLMAAHHLQDGCRFHGLSLDVTEPLARADWFVLPSTNEPCSVALIEALALGIPALVSASGGNVDIVRAEKTGLFFEPDNVTSLAGCLRRLARGEVNPLPPAEIRESVRPRSASAVAAAYARVYARAGRNPPPGSHA